MLNSTRVRVDMTKYIERHGFVFDEVFDSDATNEDVSQKRNPAPFLCLYSIMGSLISFANFFLIFYLVTLLGVQEDSVPLGPVFV